MNILDNYKRKQALKLITGDMGRVVETEKEIICYVKQGSLKEFSISLFGCNNIKNIDVVRKFNINKPVRYVFEELRCSCDIYGYASDVTVEFINCDFKYCACINLEGDCKIENCIFPCSLSCNIFANNLILSSSEINPMGNKKFHIGSCKQLILTDMNINRGSYSRLKKLHLSSEDNILIENTDVDCADISIWAKEVTAVNSNINASGSATIESDEISNLVVDSPIIVCNDVNIYSGKININKKVTSLSKKREKLIQVLKEIETRCEISNKIEIDNFVEEVKNKQISRVLKR
jgi:hypothetical protein